MSSSHKSSVMSLASDVKSGSLKDREKAVDELAHLLNPRNSNANLADLGDKSYHEIFESIFNFVLKEKPSLYDKRKAKTTTTAAATRLTKCATAVRMAVARGVSKLGRKTLLAIIDHITQVLPGPNDDFVQPLLQDYVKALAELLSRQAHVELLARKGGDPWEECVDFFLNLAAHILPDDSDTATLPSSSRASPAPGTTPLHLTPRPSPYSQNQRRAGHAEGGPLRDALEGLHHLVSGANAPVLRRQKDITDVVLRVLRIKHLSLGSIQTLSFAIANAIFSAIQAEELEDANTLVKNLVPLMAYWWRDGKVSQDELIRALRNEISKAIFFVHLHLEYLAVNSTDGVIHSEIEYLVDPLWSEYSKRSEAFRLQLVDITFLVSNLPEDYLHNSLFGLHPHNVEGESYWALVQNLAFLESVLLRYKADTSDSMDGNEEQPRKKRRTRENSSRLRLKLKAKDLGVRRTALQLVPFILATGALGVEEVGDLLVNLIVLAADKEPITASWALIACASCATIPGVHHDRMDIWRQVWHLAARAVSLPATSRAACELLHTILKADFLPYHAMSEEINNMIMTADVNGPAVLSDTSVALMLHLFHVRNTRLPNASHSTCNHIIRWVFLRWNPSEPAYASFQSKHVQAFEFVNLLRACCGLKPLVHDKVAVSGGSLSEAWISQRETSRFNEYLLLLGEKGATASKISKLDATRQQIAPLADPSILYASKKLVLELLFPKLEALEELSVLWTKKPAEGGIQISLERFQSLLMAVIIGSMLVPQIVDLNTTRSSNVEPLLIRLAEKSLTTAVTSVEPLPFIDLTFRMVRPCIPGISTTTLQQLRTESPGLLLLLTKICDKLEQREALQNSYDNADSMEIEQEFDSQASRASLASAPVSIPRHNTQLRMDPKAFYTDTRRRLGLIRIIHHDEGQVGLVPDLFIEETLAMSDEDLLSCQRLLIDIFKSDLIPSSDVALNVIERIGAIMAQLEYQYCEVAFTACIEVIDGLHAIWLHDNHRLSENVGDLYNHFIKACLPANIFSPKVQMTMARFLLTLMRVDPGYGNKLGIESCRTSLLYILSRGPMAVKYFIGDKIAKVFDLYILKLHDEVFVDVLDSLPQDPDNVSGIAFRLLVLSKLACRWPTLLRRCTYHIFETPGKITHSIDYATRCLEDVSQALDLGSPKELFHLFSRQLLYTWLESDLLDDIPFSIFGFANLAELLRSAQAEAVGLMVMRGQHAMSADLARILRTTESDMIKRNFATAMAYSMIYGDAFGGDDQGRGESHVEKKIGKKALMEAKYANFVGMVALFFDLIDQDNAIEKAFLKHRDLMYAGEVMKVIKGYSHSAAELPPNQQPMFKAKFLVNEVRRLCEDTIFDVRDLWTPALVVSIARKLLNTVHPALGSLHACSVIRKVRILICLAGPVALESYVLEMLLNSIRGFIVDAECADDALGISRYLLAEGSNYLSQTPSFLAGYALSTLASLRVFLESSQASTTQENQFKATMTKAQEFHGWLTEYLATYDSPMFKSTGQSESFRSITESAARIRSSGNAEKGTFESKLLLDILRDGSSDDQLLNESSRQLALGLLCNEFTMPIRSLDDVVGNDQDAISYATEIWRSCEAHSMSDEYLSWAGRVMGRSFSASGEIPNGVLRETRLAQYQKIAPNSNGSEMALLCLLQELTSSPDSKTAGLAETALRKSVSQAIFEEDELLTTACEQSLTEALFLSSQWGNYRSPHSEIEDTRLQSDGYWNWTADVASSEWLSQLSVHLSQSVASQSIVLSALPSILSSIKGFAEKAFPFVVHLVLFFQLDQHQTIKRSLSGAMKQWLKSTAPAAKDNLKLLLNAVLYLRTQEYPKELSIADRAHWLDIDYALASAAASRCGMYKTALLFAELVSSEATRSSRRSSLSREADINDTLLSIFENIDDPDAYYGLPEDASLSKVLARVEYESEGMKSLAFRGAQYDSHLRQRNDASEADAQALVKALNTLGLSGLSHSLLQTQQSIRASSSSLENTFGTAQKLEMWNLPAPPESDHHAVVIYKAFQSMHQATDISLVRSTIYNGFKISMDGLTGQGMNATGFRKRLGALAALTELDDLMNISDPSEIDSILDKFQSRSQWMKSGLYDDVSQILSSRGTTMSMLAQHANLLKNARTTVGTLRKTQVKSILMSAGIYRYYQATQESINISTTLMDLLPACEQQGLKIEAAIKIESANSLWDHGEMSTSIRILQSIEKESLLKNQTIPISRSDLLSKIGHRVSVARLEKPQDIQKKYLEPALKELKGNVKGKEAGSVYHQFALFCDGQLQDPAGLEDLARLQSLKKGKSDEVAELQSLISSTRDTQLRTRYSHVLSKEKQWLNLDEQELRRVEQTRSEFVRLSLENYLLSLIASDEYNNDALRFIALWLERSDEDTTNKAVKHHLHQVPTRKFATLMNQLSSRLQGQDNPFQKLLMELLYNICVDHPYHGMYQIWSGTKVKPQQKDEVAVNRVKATDKVAQRLAATKSVAEIWLAIDKTSKYYHILAMEKNASKYKSGVKVNIKDSVAASNLVNYLNKYRIPPPTMDIPLSVTKDYTQVPTIMKLEPIMSIASGVSAPKIITAVGTDGVKYRQLVKGGHDDLRQDAIMEQVFAAVSSLLKLHRATQQRNLGIRTYKVLPLTASSGLIEFVPNTIPLHEFLMPAHERYHPKDMNGSQCRKEIFQAQNRTTEQRVAAFRKVTEKFQPVMKYFFMENFVDPDEWFARRLAYTRSTAAISMLGHVLGLGDRHGHNILLDTATGEAVHIDLGVAFEAGRILPVPELVPFRLTRDIVDGMGITKTEGVFRRCCEFTLDALREEQYSIMTILDVLRYDPLYTWSISPLRLAKLQKARNSDEGTMDETEQSEAEVKRSKKDVNEPSEADRALEVVRKKLSKTLSVTATVNDLINQAMDETNLAVLYSGWAAYA